MQDPLEMTRLKLINAEIHFSFLVLAVFFFQYWELLFN